MNLVLFTTQAASKKRKGDERERGLTLLVQKVQDLDKRGSRYHRYHPPPSPPPPCLAAVGTAGAAAICHSSSTLSLLPTRVPLHCELTALREVKKTAQLNSTQHCLSTSPNSNSVHTRFHITTDVRSLSPEARDRAKSAAATAAARQEALVPRSTAPSPGRQRSIGCICGNAGPRAEREPIYAGENIFVLRVKGSHFQQFHALFAGPVLGWQREACSSRQSRT